MSLSTDLNMSGCGWFCPVAQRLTVGTDTCTYRANILILLSLGGSPVYP